MAAAESQKILNGLEKRRPVHNTEVTMESDNITEQVLASGAEPSKVLRLLPTSNHLLDGARTEGNTSSACLSDTMTDTEELFAVPIAEEIGKYSLSSTFRERKAFKFLYSG